MHARRRRQCYHFHKYGLDLFVHIVIHWGDYVNGPNESETRSEMATDNRRRFTIDRLNCVSVCVRCTFIVCPQQEIFFSPFAQRLNKQASKQFEIAV